MRFAIRPATRADLTARSSTTERSSEQRHELQEVRVLAWWSDKYVIGIDEIDEQHKEIIDMLNRMRDALPKKDAANDVAETITALAIYAKVHFKTEEAFMARIAYPYLERQKRAHAEMLQKIQSMLINMKRGDTPSAREMLAFLKQWLVGHIEKEDLLIKQFLESRKKAVKA
jgi:hemerythrin-like metal-binding protein